MVNSGPINKAHLPETLREVVQNDCCQDSGIPFGIHLFVDFQLVCCWEPPCLVSEAVTPHD